MKHIYIKNRIILVEQYIVCCQQQHTLSIKRMSVFSNVI